MVYLSLSSEFLILKLTCKNRRTTSSIIMRRYFYVYIFYLVNLVITITTMEEISFKIQLIEKKKHLLSLNKVCCNCSPVVESSLKVTNGVCYFCNFELLKLEMTYAIFVTTRQVHIK